MWFESDFWRKIRELTNIKFGTRSTKKVEIGGVVKISTCMIYIRQLLALSNDLEFMTDETRVWSKSLENAGSVLCADLMYGYRRVIND